MDAIALPISFADIEAAAERIKNRVRRTPCLRTRFIREPLRQGPTMLKLECLQVTGAFKVRGANNAILQLDDSARARGVVTASGGNHGIAVAYAAHASACPAIIYLPEAAPSDKAERCRAWGADVVVEGAGWDEAQAAALARAEADGLSYIHPFADPQVIAGQGTIAREMLKQSPEIDVIVAGIGGGGLIAGIALAAKAMKPEIRIIGVEPVGAPTLKNSLAAGETITLDAVDTKANTLAPRRSADINVAIIGDLVDDIVLVSDDEMHRAARWLWFEMGQAVELAGAAAIAAIQTGKASAPDEQLMAAVVCGNGRLDRSPCGTGTSARLALLHAKGLIGEGETLVHESPFGTYFSAEIVATTTIGDRGAVISTIAGQAWITGIMHYGLDPTDPLPEGHTPADVWFRS